MCGIYGFVKGPNGKVDINHALDCIINAEDGGKDSWGAFCLFNDNKAKLYKDVGPVSNILLHGDIIKAIEKSTMVLVHTRNASMGAINHANAQPFYAGKYIMLHNGHINQLGNEDKSDSRELSEIMAKEGLCAIKPYLETGWANLVIYNLETRKLILSPEPNVSRIVTATRDGSLHFASVKSWLNPLKAKTTLEEETFLIKIRTLERRGMSKFRPRKVIQYTVSEYDYETDQPGYFSHKYQSRWWDDSKPYVNFGGQVISQREWEEQISQQ